nr:NADH-plastoquinone oxidoreductase subunit 4L [Cymbaria mongolica]UYS85102.1 NADH-plastoquinone oxidoreductase subunit 4L [Cymbaria mongolica]
MRTTKSWLLNKKSISENWDFWSILFW